MKCPFCGSRRSNIKQKEKEPRYNYLMRYRVCRECGLTYSTYEVVVPATLMVEKSKVDPRTKEHVLEEFERTKLIGGILLAFDRDEADEKAIDIAGRVMRELIHSREHVVRSTEIGKIVERAFLQRGETGAALRFAILYERLQSIEDVLKSAEAQDPEQASRDLKAKPGPPDVCPYCGKGDTFVITTRLASDDAPNDHRVRREFKPAPGEYVLRRRRECKKCEERYTSHEMTWAFPPLTVIKTDGRREPFDYRKLAVSIQNAWGKSAIDEDVRTLTRDVTREIASVPRPKEEIPSWDIGDIVLRHLRDGGHDLPLVRYRLRHRGIGRERDRREIKEIEAILKEIQIEKNRRLGEAAPAIE